MTSTFEKLQNIVGKDFVSDNKYIRYTYSKTGDSIYQELPDYVIRPNSAEDISEIMRLANTERIPVTVRGGGQDFLREPFHIIRALFLI